MRSGHQPKAIGELCNFINGNGFRPPDWKASGLPIIRIQNLNGSTSFNYFEGTPNTKWIVEPGDLLFAWAGVRGVSFGPTIWPGPRGVLNQHIFRVVPNKGVDKYWLYLALQVATRRIEANAHGFKASLVHVQKDDITNQIVELPSLLEQRNIAKILRAWDEAIEKTERLLDAARRYFDALRADLYREDGAEERLTLGNFLDESRIPGNDGRTARKLTVKLYGKGIEPKQERTAGSANTKYYIRRAGQFIYSRLDFLNGAFAVVPPHLDGFQSTLDLPAFDVAPRVNPIWLLNYFTRPTYYESQQTLARGQRIARRINPDDLLASEIAVPKRERQDEIVAIITLSIDAVNRTRSLVAAVRRQKAGLMQKLLTGEIRVPGAAADLSPAVD